MFVSVIWNMYNNEEAFLLCFPRAQHEHARGKRPISIGNSYPKFLRGK